VAWVLVGDHDKRDAAIRRDVGKEFLEGFQASCGRANTDDWKWSAG
jgi:hypothetical protein